VAVVDVRVMGMAVRHRLVQVVTLLAPARRIDYEVTMVTVSGMSGLTWLAYKGSTRGFSG
jgi:hypothetical protein